LIEAVPGLSLLLPLLEVGVVFSAAPINAALLIKIKRRKFVNPIIIILLDAAVRSGGGVHFVSE